MSDTSKSIELIRFISNALGELNDSAVFVGGATVPFYIPSVYWPQARATDDIDIVLEVIRHTDNWQVNDRLQKKGFVNDMSGGSPICRWVYKGIKVDVMSTEESIFGFTNSWYKEGVACALELKPPWPRVKILSLPYFLATKLEAFHGRGKGDYLGSHDLEDIISILETLTKKKLKANLIGISDNLKAFLRKELLSLKVNEQFLDAIPGSVFNRLAPEKGVENVLNGINLILEGMTS